MALEISHVLNLSAFHSFAKMGLFNISDILKNR